MLWWNKNGVSNKNYFRCHALQKFEVPKINLVPLVPPSTWNEQFHWLRTITVSDHNDLCILIIYLNQYRMYIIHNNIVNTTRCDNFFSFLIRRSFGKIFFFFINLYRLCRPWFFSFRQIGRLKFNYMWTYT